MRGRVLFGGAAQGSALVLREPLSLWGGLDAETGVLIDAHHPQRGMVLADRVLVMPAGRGSSSSSSVLAEAIRSGHAPAAILLGEPDLILAVGAAVGSELYGSRIPVVAMDAADLAGIADGAPVRIGPGGEVEVG
jgi:predicted aconitase with swiveling domain